MKLNKKTIMTPILIVALILLFSTLAYAKPFTDVLRDSLVRINDFFGQENYKPYAKTIDFFIFSLVFISIYLIGVRYAFKEVKRPEQAIAIVLGFTTAFLLVLGDYSIAMLLPYMQYFIYALVFIMWMLLLKGIKSKFWRFILALLLTLLTVGLVQWLYGLLSTPEIGTLSIGKPTFLGGLPKSLGDFFKSLGDNFKGMNFQPPEVPASVKSLGEGPPVVAPTPATTTPAGSSASAPTTPSGPVAPSTPAPTTPSGPVAPSTPAPTTPSGPAAPSGTTTSWYNSWYMWAIYTIAFFSALTNRHIGGKINTKLGKWGAVNLSSELGLETSIMIDQINKIIKEKEERIGYIKTTHELKNRLINLGENKEKLIEQLEKASGANLWTDEGRKLIKNEHPILNELLEIEDRIRYQLKALRVTEEGFIGNLDKWKSLMPQQYFEYLKKLVDSILKTISVYDTFEKRDEASTKEIEQLMQEGRIKELVHGKFKNVREDWNKLQQYNEYEHKIVQSLAVKIKRQMDVLLALEKRLEKPKMSGNQERQSNERQGQANREEPKHQEAA